MPTLTGPLPRRALTRAGVVAVLVAAAAAAAVTFARVSGVSVSDVQHAVDGLGVSGYAVVFALYYLGALLALPGTLLSGAAGVLLGPFAGSVVAVTAGLSGAATSFTIARKLGRERVRKLLGPRLRRADTWVTDHAILSIVALRFLPVTPSNAFNYIAGLSGIRLRDFVVATAVSIIPGRVALATAGGSLDDPLSPPFIAASATIVALVAIGTALNHRR